ncbi:MAG: aldo/keto reductase [Methylocella sp.]
MFVTTKLWNNNHRPERVKPAIEASRQRLRLDYVDCYLVHTPFAFQPGDAQDPRDERGQVIYDPGVTLVETWQALECLVDEGQRKTIGLKISIWRNRKRLLKPRETSRSWGLPIIRLLRVLGDPIPEGPILFLHLNEIDEYVLGTQP